MTIWEKLFGTPERTAETIDGGNRGEGMSVLDEIRPEWGALKEAVKEIVDENAKLRESLEFANDGWEKDSIEFLNLRAENAKLREQMERLITMLRNDCDIDASWDGLRRFWTIGLTEDGCLMRDRACKAEAENAKLRLLVKQMYPRAKAFSQLCVQLGSNDTLSYDWELQMRELGVEVPE